MTTTSPEDLKTCLDNAKFYCNELLASIFPVRNPDHRDDGDLEKEKTEGVTERKAPAVESLESYKKERVNEQQIDKWSKENQNCNFGMFPGKVSNNIIVFDIDGDDAIDRLNKNVLQNYQYGIGSALLNTMTVTTGSGGRHYYVILNDPIIETLGTKKIWKNNKEKHTEIVIFAGGRYVLIAGCRHTYGNIYTWNGKKPIPISRKELEQFIGLIQNNNGGNNDSSNSSSDNKVDDHYTQQHQQIPLTNNKNNGEDMTIAEARLINSQFGNLYRDGSRNDWWLEASGLLKRHGIPKMDAIAICKKICQTMNDEQAEDRVKTVTDTYDKKDAVEVAGWNFLKDFVQAHMQGGYTNEKLEERMKWVKQEILAAIFELKLDIIKRDNPWGLSSGGKREEYIVIRKSDNDVEVVDYNRLARIRRVQVLEVTRKNIDIGGNVDNTGRGDITNLEFTEVLIDAVPHGKIQIVKDPLFGGVRYHIDWECVDRSTDKFRIEKRPDNELKTKEELEKWLKSETAWVRKPQKLREAIDSTISGYENKSADWVETREEIKPSGFFWYNGKIVVSKIGMKQLTQEEVKKAAKTLIEFKKLWYSGNKGRDELRFSDYLKKHIVGGFDYVRKQRELIAKYGIVPRGDLCGWHGAGKSEFGKLGCYLRGIPVDDLIISQRAVRTQARLIHELGKTTLPITLEEVGFLSKTERPGVEDMISTLKDSVTKLHGDRLTKEHDEIIEPLLAPVYLTHNAGPVIEGGMSRRFIIDKFTQQDQKENKDDPESIKRVKAYATYVEKHKEDLRNIGHFVDWYVVNEDPDILANPYQKIGSELLQALFLAAGIEYPKWLDYTIEDLELIESGVSGASTASDYSEYFREQNIAALKSYYNDEFVRQGRIFKEVEYLRPEDQPFEKRVKWLCETNRVSGQIYDKATNTLYFTAGIKGTLKRYNVDVDKAYQSIDNFASVMGFEFTRKQIEKDAPQARAAFVDMEKFIRILDRSEFQEINKEEEAAADHPQTAMA